MNLTNLIFSYIIYYVSCVGVLGADNVTLLVSVVYPAAFAVSVFALRKLINRKAGTARTLRRSS